MKKLTMVLAGLLAMSVAGAYAADDAMKKDSKAGSSMSKSGDTKAGASSSASTGSAAGGSSASTAGTTSTDTASKKKSRPARAAKG